MTAASSTEIATDHELVPEKCECLHSRRITRRRNANELICRDLMKNAAAPSASPDAVVAVYCKGAYIDDSWLAHDGLCDDSITNHFLYPCGRAEQESIASW